MDIVEIQSVLQKLGERVPPASSLILVGGSALALLGNQRQTIDIDFVGDDVSPNQLHQTILRVAKELKISAEPVPLDRFVPLPKGSEERIIRIGTFGNLEVFVADPYSIALSKLDRGFDTDLADIVFLIRTGRLIFDDFERMVRDALPHASKYDFNPDFLEHLQELKRRLKSFWSNEAIFQLMMLAYNLFLLFKIDFLRTTEYRQQIKTFRLKYIFLAGKIIKTARSVVMKLSEKYPYREIYEHSLSG